MSILNITDLKKEYGINEVLNGFSMHINEGERIALIGANGSGKTTVFKLIAGKENYSEGNISIRNDIELGYLDQLPDFEADLTIYAELEKVFQAVIEQIASLKEYEEKIARYGKRADGSTSDSPKLNKLMREYSQLQEEFNQGIAYEYQSKIRQVAAGLGFNEEELYQKKLGQLSGGEKTRLGLIKLLLTEPDLLLLDEPTNHLDLKAVEWLENYLNSYQGTLLIISHDRYFLDNVVNRIVEIKNGKNEDYTGNYSYYKKARKRRYEQRLREYKNQQKKIKELEDAIEQLYIWGRSRDSEKMFKRAKAMQKRLDKIDRLEKPTLKGRKMNLNLNTEVRGGNDVLKVENLAKSFADLNLFRDLNLELYRGDKAAIIGDNGSGKTTLLRIIMGEIKADSGQIKIGTNIYPDYYRQEFDGFDEQDDLITALRKETRITVSEARNRLAAFLFTGEDVFKKVSQLSGGEKSRLRLLQLMSGNYNFLILDEPTNHLDLPSREVLEDALKEFEGTVLIVSHDRYFLDEVVDYIYELENSVLKKYYGNYSYYSRKKEKINIESDATEAETINQGKLDYEAQKRARNEEMQRQKSLEETEAEIEKLENNLAEIESELTAEENLSDFELLQDLKEKYKRLNNRLDKLYKKWEELLKH
ncbi:ribosomal protection-like ABC-F family protein [Halanaerobium hydrogeniformans]|uniref:ABC transporter related protein n=1 Tax=Halanaerobium hydrogeniformans TaxID=656519 RepID=E4RMP3_HALHG|nr:ABC-F family ATP-binding cassette domain-containing protein [Halanaerobium hydrogeniformans]ADQ14574.1 ABC transporter related protein [Halanaerobium hydrogeniformans]